MDDLFRKMNDDLMGSSDSPILEEWEVEAIIIAFARKRDEEGFTEEECIKVIKWCESQRIGNALVDLVVKGLASINWSNEENEPSFQITPEGIEVFKGENDGAAN